MKKVSPLFSSPLGDWILVIIVYLLLIIFWKFLFEPIVDKMPSDQYEWEEHNFYTDTWSPTTP